MAFDFGAALTSAGDVGPSLQQARQNILDRQEQIAERKRAAEEFTLGQREKTAQTVAQEQKNKLWTPVRTYTGADRAQHTIYLTPEGYKDQIDAQDPLTERQQYLDAVKKMGVKVSDQESSEYLLTGGLKTRASTAGAAKAPNVVQDANSPTGWSKVYYNPYDGEEYSRVPTSPTSFGNIPQQTTTNATDPLGLTTHTESIRQPAIPKAGQPSGALPPVRQVPIGQTPQAAPSGARPTRIGGAQPPQQENPNAIATPKGIGAILTPPGMPQLTDDGHIPPNVTNPNVVSAANAFIDGNDWEKITGNPRLKALAQSLLDRYGMGRTMYSPKELHAAATTLNFLRKLQDAPELNQLNKFGARFASSEVLNEKPGLFTMLASSASSQQTDTFNAYFNALSGVVSGLAATVRPGRAATDTMMDNLRREMPNPATTKNVQGAKLRLNNMITEMRNTLGPQNMTKLEAIIKAGLADEFPGGVTFNSAQPQQKSSPAGDPAVDQFLLNYGGGNASRPK